MDRVICRSPGFTATSVSDGKTTFYSWEALAVRHRSAGRLSY